MNPYREPGKPVSRLKETFVNTRRWMFRVTPGTMFAWALLVAGVAIAATPALRVNGLKFGNNDNSVYLRAYGCVGDGSTDDTTCLTNAVAALANGATLYATPGNYKVNSPITIAFDNITIQGATNGSTTFTQGTAGQNVFVSTGHNGLAFRSLNFVGVSGATSFSTDSAIRVTTATGLTVKGCTFTNFRSYAVTARTVSTLDVSDNSFTGNRSLLAQGGSNQTFRHNFVFAPQTNNAEFTVALQFDSTSSGFGASTDVTVTDNQFYNWPGGQGVLLHSGQRFAIANNTFYNTYEPINLSPVQAGDVLEDGTVTGNVCNVATTSGVGIISAGNYGIFAGGIAGQTARRIAIKGNYVINGNGYSQQDTWGAIAVGTADDILIEGNEIVSAYGNGIALNGPNNRISVRGNHIETVNNSVGSLEVGIGVWANTSQTGVIDGNFIDNVKQGIRLDVNTSGGIVVGTNQMTNIASTRILNPTNGTQGIVIDGAGGIDSPIATTLPICNANCNSLTLGNTAAAISGNASSWSLTSPSGLITMTAGTASTWDSKDGTLKAATIDRSTAGTLNVCNGTCTTIGIGNSASQGNLNNATTTFVRAIQCTVNSIAQSTATMALDARAGCNAVVTLTANVTTVTLSNFGAGQPYSITFVQGGAGSFTVTGWPASVKWLPTAYRGTTHTAPTLTTAIGSRDTIYFRHDGTNLVEVEENLNN